MSTSPPGADAMRDVLATGPRPAAPGVLSTCAAFGWRGLRRVRRVPEQLIDVTIGPVVLLVLFTCLLGGATSGSSGAYLQVLLPAILVQAILFTSLTSGLALHADRTTGVVDRFRSLPVLQPAPFVGSVLADALRYVLAGTVVVLSNALVDPAALPPRAEGVRRVQPGLAPHHGGPRAARRHAQAADVLLVR